MSKNNLLIVETWFDKASNRWAAAVIMAEEVGNSTEVKKLNEQIEHFATLEDSQRWAYQQAKSNARNWRCVGHHGHDGMAGRLSHWTGRWAGENLGQFLTESEMAQH